MPEDVFASTEGQALLQEFTKLVATLNEQAEGKFRCKGKMHTNAKGEVQFEVSTRADTPQEISSTNQTILEGLINLCNAKKIKIAGGSA